MKKDIKSAFWWELTRLSPKFIVIIIENKTLDSSPGSSRKQLHCSCPPDSETSRSQTLLWYHILIGNISNMIIPSSFVIFNHHIYCWVGNLISNSAYDMLLLMWLFLKDCLVTNSSLAFLFFKFSFGLAGLKCLKVFFLNCVFHMQKKN